jgi:hypothetical protein
MKRRKGKMPDPKKEREWADEIPDGEEEEEYEPTYRDGSAQNECWDADDLRGHEERRRG